MKLANTALQKYRDSAVIQSLKAVALEKMGRAEEAFQVRLLLVQCLEGFLVDV